MDIKKVVQLTNEQYEELLKNGQVEVNGEIKTKEDNTVYVCPVSESWAELNNKIDRVLSPQELEEIPVYDLQTYVSNIIEKDTTLQDKSYFVFTCELKKDEKIEYDSSKHGKIFVNGKELTSTHVNIKNQNEIFRVVVFANDSILDLSDEPDYTLLGDILLNQKSQNIIFHLKYQKGINEITCYGRSSSLSSKGKYNTMKHYSKNGYDLPGLPNGLDKLISNIEEIPAGASPFANTTTPFECGAVILPELKKIGCNTSRANGFAYSEIKSISFPKVEIIEGRSAQEGAGSFYNVSADMVIPETCMYIGNYLFNSTAAKITLNCKYATIENTWIYTNSALLKITLCEDWQTSINLSKLSTGTTPAIWYKDAIKNKLANRTGQDVLIFTVPTAIFTTLNTEKCDIENHTEKTWIEYATQVKNWTIQGG